MLNADLLLQTRLRYVAFKRVVWALETLLLLMGFLVLVATGVPTPWFGVALGIQVLRVLTEAMNHGALAEYHHVGDAWRLSFPFV